MPNATTTNNPYGDGTPPYESSNPLPSSTTTYNSGTRP
jgi:hypothetical protein